MAKKIVDETLKFTVVINGNEGQKEFTKLEKANRKLIASNEDLEKKARKVKRAGKAQRAEYEKLTKEIEKNNKEIALNDKRMSELSDEIGINNLTMRQLNKQASKLRGILGNLTPHTPKWEEYNKQLQSIKGRQANLREEMKATSEVMDEQDNALSFLITGFSELFNGIKRGNFDQVQGGLKMITSGIKNATKVSLAFIATPIGAAIAALAAVGIAAKSWFDYNAQVVEALRLTTQITGLTDDAADAARVRGEALVETFGVDFKETLETARNLSKQFGISFNEAFDIVEEDLVRGQKNNKEYFDSLKEYPTFFAQAGFSAKEFSRIVSTGYDLGIYNDKLPDALKEFDISLREQTQSTRDALVNAFGAPFTNNILNKVRAGELTTKEALEQIAIKAKDSNINIQQNAQLTADLFRGAGEDAGGALKIFEAYNVALVDNQRELTESEKITQEQVKATTELKRVTSILFSTGDKGFALWIDRAKLFGTKLLVDILKKGIDVYNWAVDLNNQSRGFSVILRSIGVFANSSFKTLGVLLSAAWEGFKGLGNIIEGIFTLDYKQIKHGFSQGLKAIPDAFSEIKEQAIKDAAELQKALNGEFKLERKSLSDFVGDDVSTIRQNAQKNLNLKKHLSDKESAELEKQRNKQKAKQAKEEAKRFSEYLKRLQKQFTSEKNLRQIAFNNQLAQVQTLEHAKRLLKDKLSEEELEKIDTLQKAREELTRQHEIRETEKQAQYLKGLLEQYSFILSSQGSQFNLAGAVLTEEQKEELNQRIEDVRLKLSELGLENTKLKGKGEDEEEQDEESLVDIFGFTSEQWELMYANLEKGKFGVQEIQMAVGALMNMWSTYDRLVTQSENSRLKASQKLAKKEKKVLQDKLDQGLISREEYNEKVKAIDVKVANEKAKIEYKQAKRKKAMAIVDTIINTAMSIMQAYSQLGPIGGSIAAVLIGTLGALQINEIRKQPLPDQQGFEEGLYPVRRKQDGKTYQSRVSYDTSTQLVPQPTTFLAGERPEMIIDPDTFKKMDPKVTDYILALAGKPVTGYESGKYSSSKEDVSNDAVAVVQESETEMMTLEVLTDLRNILASGDIKAKLYFGLEDEIERQKLEDQLTEIIKSSEN